MRKVTALISCATIILSLFLPVANAAYETKPVPFFMPCKTDLDN